MRPATHGVLVTYRRPEALASHLARLAAQTSPLSTLTVVDNDADVEVRRLVHGPMGQAAATTGVRYLAADDNIGPAGGFHLGIAAVLGTDPPDDEIIVLLDDDDPPRTDTVFADTLAVLDGVERARCDVGGIGCWGAVLGDRGRLRMATEPTPTRVDYLAGGACPHYRVAALRTVPGPDPALFFGFEELDLGRAIARAGWTLWSTGMAREHGWGERVTRTRPAAVVTEPTWRRYYSVRNLITVLRKDGRTGDAVFVSLTAGLVKPVLNLAIRPRRAWRTLRLTVPAVADGWRGRLGRRVEPAPAA